MYLRNFLLFLCVISSCLLITSCNKEELSPEEKFINKGIIELSESALYGIWVISSVEFEGRTVAVPANYPECGPNFFIYQENGNYIEYLYENNSCQPQILEYSWTLNRGVVTISNNIQQENIVITKSNESSFSFLGRFDINQDEEKEEVVFNCNRYQPTEVDIYSRSFLLDFERDASQSIKFKWQEYTGFNQFVRYELYRSDNFEHINSELIATFTDSDIVSYTEENPPRTERLCYKLKIYTDKGLLGESNSQCIFTEELAVLPVQIAEPAVSSTEISLNWEISENPYFDHYLITTSNYTPGYSGYRFQEQEVAIISDQSLTSFIDDKPPHFKDPWYNIYVVNVFGTKSKNYGSNISGSKKITYTHPSLLPYKHIYAFAPDPDENVIYYYGLTESYETPVLIKQDYTNNQIIGNPIPIQNSTAFRGIKLFSSSYGKEIFFIKQSEIRIYDATSMTYKYTLDPSGLISIDDMIYTDDEILFFVDNDELHSFTRVNSALSPVDTMSIYGNFQSNVSHGMLELQDNTLLIGHKDKPQSIVFNWDNSGNLMNKTIYQFRSFPDLYHNPIFNLQNLEILVIPDKVFISSQTFNNSEYFNSPTFPSGLSLDGNLVFGTNNDPEWPPQTESPHLKQAIFFDRTTRDSEFIEAQGYPLFIFENNSGEIFSISSGLKIERISTHTQDYSFFVEKLR